jgi:hypothetical protein
MRWLAAAITGALVLTINPPVHAAENPRIGLLIVDHGEPPEYNELTYESFREFFNHLIEMGLIPSWLKLLDTGTVTVDLKCPFCEEPSTEPKLMNAWLGRHDGLGVFVPASDSLPAHYVVPGGPGLGEPDIFEHVGVQAWHEWELMGGRSPNYDEKLPKKLAVIKRLQARYGDDLPVRIGYGIDPRLNGRRQGIRQAVAGLVNRERVDHVVVAYHGVGFSDIMQTHMIRHEIEETLDAIAPEVTASYAKPIGTTDLYVDAVVGKVRTELKRLPSNASVAIHLSGHGLPTDMCGDYDCGADSYHESSRALFQRTKKAIMRSVDHDGRLDVFHIYGDGGSGDDDAEDEVDSPMEALAKRKDAGFAHVVDIPYEFDSNSRDTLIILRRGYGRPIPDWNADYESSFKYEGIDVRITDCSYSNRKKIAAFEDVIVATLRRARDMNGGDHGH